MPLADLRTVLLRDLKGLIREVQAYPNDEAPWAPIPGIANCGGTLVLHLAGNLQHFVGALLGGSGYIRDREAEFATRGLSRAELVAHIDRTIAAVEPVLARLTEARLAEPFPAEIAGKRPTVGRFLTHLATHLAYHLGQVDYHRRAVAPESGVVGAVAVAEL